MKVLFSCAVLVAAACVLVGAGGAPAADGNGSGTSRCERMWAKLAEKRGVTVEQLRAQWRAKAAERIDAAVAKGRLGAARAAELKARLAKLTGCPSGERRAHRTPKQHRGGFMASAIVRTTSTFLGLSPAQLRAELLEGTTLATLAEKQGKSVSGLKALFLGPFTARLDAAVAKGRLKPEWRDRMVAGYTRFVDALVTRSFGARAKAA
jgi:hypothetical protein